MQRHKKLGDFKLPDITLAEWNSKAKGPDEYTILVFYSDSYSREANVIVKFFKENTPSDKRLEVRTVFSEMEVEFNEVCSIYLLPTTIAFCGKDPYCRTEGVYKEKFLEMIEAVPQKAEKSTGWLGRLRSSSKKDKDEKTKEKKKHDKAEAGEKKDSESETKMEINDKDSEDLGRGTSSTPKPRTVKDVYVRKEVVIKKDLVIKNKGDEKTSKDDQKDKDVKTKSEPSTSKATKDKADAKMQTRSKTKIAPESKRSLKRQQDSSQDQELGAADAKKSKKT